MIHFNAIKALITDPAVNVHIGTAQLSSPPVSTDFPYVVIGGTLTTDFSGGDVDDETLADDPQAFQATIRLTYAAMNEESLSILIGNVRPALNRQQPVIEGYFCERLRLRSLMTTTTDRDIPLSSGLHPIFAIDETRLIAQKH